MKHKILLTSFQTWLSHQKSNSSDDILEIIQNKNYSFASMFFLRNLPVDIELAKEKAISAIATIKPDAIICCGMAEKRNKLSIESNATYQNKCLYTNVDLVGLSSNLVVTEISHNAGKFVCEGLYYHVLNYIQAWEKDICCIFVHVPLLTTKQLSLIEQDFYHILFRLAHELTRKDRDIKHR